MHPGTVNPIFLHSAVPERRLHRGDVPAGQEITLLVSHDGRITLLPLELLEEDDEELEEEEELLDDELEDDIMLPLEEELEDELEEDELEDDEVEVVD